MTPDFEFRPTADIELRLDQNLLPDKATKALDSLAPSVTDVEMRLKEVFIYDVRDIGRGDVYIASVVGNDLTKEPFTLEVKTFQDVADGSGLQFGPGGIALYRNPKGQIPRFLDFRLLVVESDEEIRDAGQVLEEIKGTDEYTKLRDSLIALAATGQLEVAALTAATDIVMTILIGILKSNRDDQLIYVAGSFNSKLDDLGVAYGLIHNATKYARVGYQVEAA
jgi:hypothetical protein